MKWLPMTTQALVLSQTKPIETRVWRAYGSGNEKIIIVVEAGLN